ncbi:hypothetical protein ADUPG1_011012, partial [Aduncisulcus paluster]
MSPCSSCSSEEHSFCREMFVCNDVLIKTIVHISKDLSKDIAYDRSCPIVGDIISYLSRQCGYLSQQCEYLPSNQKRDMFGYIGKDARSIADWISSLKKWQSDDPIIQRRNEMSFMFFEFILASKERSTEIVRDMITKFELESFLKNYLIEIISHEKNDKSSVDSCFKFLLDLSTQNRILHPDLVALIVKTMYDKVEHIPKQYVEKWLRILMNFLPAICESSDGTKRQYLSVFVQGKLEFQLYPDKADVVSFLFRTSKIPRSKDSFLDLIEKLNVIRHVNEWLDEFKADHNPEAIDSWANLICELFKYYKTNHRVCLECLKHGCVLALLNLDGNDMTKIVKCALNNSRKLLKDGVEAVSSQKMSWEQFDEEYCSKVLPDNIEHSYCIPSIHSPQSKNVRISSNYVEIVSSWIDILTIVCQNDAKCEQESARRYAIISRFLHIITEDMLSIFSPENLLNERDENRLWKNVHKVIEFVHGLYRIYVYQKERPKILDDLFKCVKKLIKPWMKHYASVQSEHASFDNLILDLSKHHYHCYYEIQKECVPELMNYKKHHPDFSLRFNDIYIKSVFSILEEIKIYRSIPEYDDKVKRGFRYLDEILSKSLHHSDQDKGKIEKAMKPGYVSSLCLGLLEMMKNAEYTPTIGVSTPHPQASPNESVRKLFEKFNPSLSNVIVCNAESHPGEKDSKDIQETV